MLGMPGRGVVWTTVATTLLVALMAREGGCATGGNTIEQRRCLLSEDCSKRVMQLQLRVRGLEESLAAVCHHGRRGFAKSRVGRVVIREHCSGRDSFDGVEAAGGSDNTLSYNSTELLSLVEERAPPPPPPKAPPHPFPGPLPVPPRPPFKFTTQGFAMSKNISKGDEQALFQIREALMAGSVSGREWVSQHWRKGHGVCQWSGVTCKMRNKSLRVVGIRIGNNGQDSKIFGRSLMIQSLWKDLPVPGPDDMSNMTLPASIGHLSELQRFLVLRVPFVGLENSAEVFRNLTKLHTVALVHAGFKNGLPNFSLLRRIKKLRLEGVGSGRVDLDMIQSLVDKLAFKWLDLAYFDAEHIHISSTTPRRKKLYLEVRQCAQLRTVELAVPTLEALSFEGNRMLTHINVTHAENLRKFWAPNNSALVSLELLPFTREPSRLYSFKIRHSPLLKRLPDLVFVDTMKNLVCQQCGLYGKVNGARWPKLLRADLRDNAITGLAPSWSLVKAKNYDLFLSNNPVRSLPDGMEMNSVNVIALKNTPLAKLDLAKLDVSEGLFNKPTAAAAAIFHMIDTWESFVRSLYRPICWDRDRRFVGMNPCRSQKKPSSHLFGIDLKCGEFMGFGAQVLNELVLEEYMTTSCFQKKADDRGILPSSIGSLNTVRYLTIESGWILNALPDDFGQSRLRSIRIKPNRLQVVPEGIFRLKELGQIVIEGNPVHTFRPGAGAEVSPLATVQINGGRLASIGEGLNRLRMLGRLDIGENLIKELHPDLFSSKSLYDIHMPDNRLEKFPTGLMAMKTLRSLNIARNRMTGALPTLGAIAVLDVSGNVLDGFSQPSVEYGKALYHDIILNFEGNRFEKFPSDFHQWFAGAANLQVLNIANCRLTEFPESMATVRIKTLDISNNRLEKLPKKLPETVHAVRLARNLLSSAHDLFAKNEVDVSGNRISNLTDTIFVDVAAIKAGKYGHSIPSVMDLSFNMATVLPRQLEFLLTSGLYTQLRMQGSAVHDYWAGLNVPRLAEDMVLSIDRGMLGPDPDRVVRKMLGMGEDLSVFWTGRTPLAGSEKGLECEELSAYYTGAKVVARECWCAHGFYNAASTRLLHAIEGTCVVCPLNAVCDGGAIECVKGYYKRVVLNNKISHPECIACPDGAACQQNKIMPLPGFWWDRNFIYQSGPDAEMDVRNTTGSSPTAALVYQDPERWGVSLDEQYVFECRVLHACNGGDKSNCTDGYSGALCGTCSKQYYSDGHGHCQRCPDPTITLLMLGAGAILFGVIFCAAFMRASTYVSSRKWAQGSGPDKTALLRDSMTATKVMVSFLQVLTTLDVTFDVKWPMQLNLFDGIFGWVNLDWMRASSLECVLENLSIADDGDEASALEGFTFSYYTSLVITVSTPLITSMALFGLYALFKLLKRWIESARVMSYEMEIRAASLERAQQRCVQLHLLLWMFAYLPVSSKALNFFVCKSFDSGRTEWLAHDLSVQCYTPTYYAYIPVAGTAVAIYTIGFPVFVILAHYYLISQELVAVASRRSSKLPKFCMSVPLREIFSPLSRSYKREYGYWESIDMTRKVLIGAAVVHLGSSPVFQLTVALMISFIASVLHFYHMPFRSTTANKAAGISLVLVYLSMSIGLLGRLDVSNSHQAVFSGTVMALDGLFICVLLGVISSEFLAGVARSGTLRKLLVWCGADPHAL